MPGGGAALFLAGEDHEYCEKSKWTRRYLPDTAVSSKKGDFNTPPVFQFFKAENGGLKYDVSNRLDTQIARSLLSNGFVFGVYLFCQSNRKEPITARLYLRVIGSASLRLALWQLTYSTVLHWLRFLVCTLDKTTDSSLRSCHTVSEYGFYFHTQDIISIHFSP